MCTQVQHGTREYDEMVVLRRDILRAPLGLKFSPAELEAEKDSFHFAKWRDNTLIACLILKPMSDYRIRLRQLAVRESDRCKGVGRSLVGYAEAFARDLGYAEIVLHARQTAVGFYEKMDYEVVGKRFIEISIPHFSMRKKI